MAFCRILGVFLVAMAVSNCTTHYVYSKTVGPGASDEAARADLGRCGARFDASGKPISTPEEAQAIDACMLRRGYTKTAVMR